MNTIFYVLLLSLIGLIASIILGVRLLIKYKKSRKKIDLILGIILTYIIPGLIFLALIYIVISRTITVSYGPPPGMVYGPGPI